VAVPGSPWHFAATIGAVSTPLIPNYRDREVGFIVGFAEVKVLVVSREFRTFVYPAMVDRLHPSWPSVQHVFAVDGQPGDANPSWESFMDTPWEQRRDSPSSPRCARIRTNPDALHVANECKRRAFELERTPGA
jgi:non-ribosomal peptide synthetase component E (peptide arylation enzyme)